MEPVRVQGRFKWSTMSRFPGIPLVDTRIPTFFLATSGSADDGSYVDVYFVNNSSEVLVRVGVGVGGSLTADNESDDGMLLRTPEDVDYSDVQPHEAVGLAKFDAIYDSDFLLQLIITVRRQDGSSLTFDVMKKGVEFGDTRLMHEDGSSKFLRS